jgi:hypothetical protein
MIDITNLHIHYRTLPSNKHPKGEMKVVVIQPTDNTSTLRIKQDIARALQPLKNNAQYYYVVAEIDRDGKPGYRTLMPKVMLNE